MNQLLDKVAVIVQEEDDRSQSMVKEYGNFLESQLERTIAYSKKGAMLGFCFIMYITCITYRQRGTVDEIYQQ